MKQNKFFPTNCRLNLSEKKTVNISLKTDKNVIIFWIMPRNANKQNAKRSVRQHNELFFFTIFENCAITFV